MLRAKRAVSLLGLSAWVAIAMPADSQSGPGGSNPDKLLGAWERQLVLPQQISSRLTWAERRLQPSGLRKLEKMGRTLAPGIANGTDFDPLRAQVNLEVRAAFPALKAADVSQAAFIVLSMATKDMDDDIRMIMAEIKAMNASKQKLRGLIEELDGRITREMAKHAGSEDIDNEKVADPKTKARPPRPDAKATAPPLRRITLETQASPVIHLEYVKAPVIPPLPPQNPGQTVSGLKSMLDELKGKLDGMNEMSEMTSLRLQMTMDRRSKFIETLSSIMKKIGTTQETLVQNIK
jgi:hypothetical protein